MKAKLQVNGHRIEEGAESTIDARGVTHIYRGGFNSAFEWHEVTTADDLRCNRRRWAPGSRRTVDGSPGLTTR